MKNCRPAQFQQRRHDRHMSLDMSSCRRDSGGSYSVSCWNSGLCVPHGFTIIPHLISAVFQFFPALLIRQYINCRSTTHGSGGHASHKDIGCYKLQRKQHSNLPDDIHRTDVGVCASHATHILSRSQNKISADVPPYTNPVSRKAKCLPRTRVTARREEPTQTMNHERKQNGFSQPNRRRQRATS